MKEGAEDLWNERDGPVKSQPLIDNRGINRQIRTPIDIRKLVSEEDTIVNSPNLNSGVKPRHYSVCSRNLDDGFKLNNYALLNHSVNSMNSNNGFKPRGYSVYSVSMNSNNEFKWHCSMNLNGGIGARNYSTYVKSRKKSRFNSSDDSSDEDMTEDEGEKKGSERRFMSSAALGKYDKKTTRRVPLKFLDKEDDLSKQVEAIRNEVKKRSMARNDVVISGEGSILSQKRFDECNVSPLTVKALTQAGYVQMTRVQEATLSVCLEGNDALVKAKTGTGKSAAFLF